MKVLSLVERGGNVRSIKVESVSRPTVEKIVKENVDCESRLMTDKAPYYPRIGRQFAGHESVNHSADQWVRGKAHTNALVFALFTRRSAACTSTAASATCIATSPSSISDTTSVLPQCDGR
jgi:ISXO2-like transposase domain